MTVLTPMDPASFAIYREASATAYARDNVTSGRWPAAGALERSLEQIDQALPEGVATPDNYLYDIRNRPDGEVVGILWFGVLTRHGLKGAFVYDVEIRAEFRRHGHARAAFAALESVVKDLGLSSIGLHVFAHNPGAQALYASLGYGVTGVNMLKRLDTGEA